MKRFLLLFFGLLATLAAFAQSSPYVTGRGFKLPTNSTDSSWVSGVATNGTVAAFYVTSTGRLRYYNPVTDLWLYLDTPDPLYFRKDQNSALTLHVQNESSGVSATAELRLNTDAGDAYLYKKSVAGGSDLAAIIGGSVGDFVISGTTEIARFSNAGGMRLGAGGAVTGSYTSLRLNRNYSPTSGTNFYRSVLIDPTYNSSGGTNTIWGLYYNPTLTSTTGVEHYAINTTSGQIFFANSSGDNVTANTRLDVRGITSGTNVLRAASSSNTEIFRILETGQIVHSYGSWSTSGNLFANNATIATSTGTPSITLFNVIPNLNTTGGTTTFRAFYYNPSITSTTGLTEIAFENTRGEVRFGGVTQDDTKTRIAALDATTNRLYWRDASTLTAGGGGISNSAVNNELMKSDGTDAVSSGLFSSASGDLDMGTGTAGSARTITADGSASDVDFYIETKGSGSLQTRLALTGGGNLAVGGISHARSSQTVNYTPIEQDFLITMDATSGAKTVNLPASNATNWAGKILVILKLDSSGNTVTIDGNSSETINGSLTKVLSTQYSGVQIMSLGPVGGWLIIGTF